MTWTVADVDKDKVLLVSQKDTDGILHQGCYLTIEDKEVKKKFIVRIEDTSQNNPYKPSPLIVDLLLPPLPQDQKCQNIISASRIIEMPEREDGSSSFIKPQLQARLSNQDEVNYAFGTKDGIPVFPATVFSRSVQHLYDDAGKFVHVFIPPDVFYYQMLITGRTGSGKTVAMKYLAQYFIEKMGGAVLAVNVKEEDMLTMDSPSQTKSQLIIKEWDDLNYDARGIDTFKIYFPGNKSPNYSKKVDINKTQRITLETRTLDPETLTGLIQNISDLGADQLPSIFRYWQSKNRDKPNNKLIDFIRYFSDPAKNRRFTAQNSLGEELDIQMHSSTYQNVLNALNYATEYFDVDHALELKAQDILQPRKMSVIDVTGKYGFGFGAVLLRDLLEKLYDAKSTKKSEVPILIIIDEVHEFYGSARSREALQVLDSICRKGRSLKMGVIFASQNPEDMPRGISSVVNSKIYFKSDASNIKSLGVSISGFDPEAFRAGFGVARIHGLNQLKFLKFPMSLSGVHDA